MIRKVMMQMKIIVGTIIKEDNKILMVKESKKECYGLWNFPSGRLEQNEDVLSGAIRETLEETGHRVVLTRMLPIQIIKKGDEVIQRFMFMANIVEKNAQAIMEDEIMETRFVSLEEIKNDTIKLREPMESWRLLDATEKDMAIPLDEAFM